MIWKRLLVMLALLLLAAASFGAAERKVLHGHRPEALRRLQPVAALPGAQPLTLALTLPLRNRETLTNLLQQLYDPASPRYRQYLTPEQFTEQFGPTAADYQKLARFARAQGLAVRGTHPNRLVLDVSGPVANIEQAFGVKLRQYKHPKENRTFFAPDTEPSVDSDVPLQAISGLDNYVLPHPMNLRRLSDASPDSGSSKAASRTVSTVPNDSPSSVQSYATGSGPGGTFMGNDFRTAYAPGVTNTGAGQVIGLFQFGPYSANSIYVYQTTAHLSTNIVVTPVSVNGFNTTYNNTDDGEQCLDIEMAMSMAPDATILVYEGNNGTDIFNRIATDNLAKQISCSWGWSPMDRSLEGTFQQLAAQGQSCFVASGDSGAEVTSGFPPGDDPYLTIVGGTSLTTSGAGGPWQSETTWGGSTGGVSSRYAIPSWQQGISMVSNHGSTTMRNVPDVAMLADTVIFFAFKNGQTGTVGGTSAAAPLWAGFMALVNQQAARLGKGPVGFLNPALYALGKGPYATYATCFHDITTGNNANSSSPNNYYACAGYDLCTGWGSPTGSNTINALVGIGTNDFTLYASQVGLNLVRGSAGTSLISVMPIKSFSGSVALSLSGLPAGVSASLSPTTTATTSLLTLTTTSAALPGTSTLTVTGVSGGLTHAITFNLTIVAPFPGATPVSLASYFNRAGIYNDGRTFSGGLDGVGFAYSANLLGPVPSWNGVAFTLGAANALDTVSCAGQTIPLPAGNFCSLLMLAAAVNGNKPAQSFTVTYTDNSTTVCSQSLSDWASSQNYAGESVAASLLYRDAGGGTKDTGTPVNLFGYSFTLNQTKTVKSITLPNNANVTVLALTLVNSPTSASLAGYYNRAGLYTDGTTFTNPATGGVDGGGAAYSASLLGSAQTWNGVQFNLGPANATNVISAAAQTLPLPPGNYSSLRFLAAGMGGNQASQPFTVTYADSTTSSFYQSISDWYTPQNYAGESKAIITGHRNMSDGSKDNRTFYLYGYAFPLNSSKVVQSLRLPNNGSLIVVSVSLVPNWQPTFTRNPFTEPTLTAGQPCAGTLATNATDLNGDPLTYSKLSGPAWLQVASNGTLSGTPLSADAGANSFMVSVRDPGGLSNSATLNLTVLPAPPITALLSWQSAQLSLDWSGGIAPYQVQSATNLAAPDWQPFGAPTSATHLTLLPTNTAAFYRILGQ